VDTFRSATAGGRNRQFKEARRQFKKAFKKAGEYVDILRRADAEMAISGPAPSGLQNLSTPA